MPTARSLALLAAAALLCGLSACTTNADPAEPESAPLTVHVEQGQLQGAVKGATHTFQGIPYAQPPVGDLRWQDPRPVAPWPGVRQATAPGSQCPQNSLTGAGPSTDEDCLFVNVTTPARQTPGTELPVMVWWHGGGYTTGSGSQYDASRLAAQGVVVVTVNYRLGIFGYLGLPGLAGSGDFGLADQIAAVDWSKRNAAAFGGDPGNVTVFGESAGGMSVCALLTSPRAAGLVDKAVISSGSCRLSWPVGGLYPGTPAQTPYLSVQQDQADGLAAAGQLGCPAGAELACLRGKPAADLLPLGQNFSDHLAFGTPLLPKDPAIALQDGDFARIPVISGGNADEARSFVGGALVTDPGAVSAGNYPALVQQAFGARADQVLAQYPLTAYPSPALAWSAVVTDSSWACPTLTADRQLAAHTTVFPYEFADPDAPDVNQLKVPGLPQGAAHATDLPSLFDLGGRHLLSPAQDDLAARMIAYWTTFARTGNPNHSGDPAWDPGRPLRFVPGNIAPADLAAAHRCGFWGG